MERIKGTEYSGPSGIARDSQWLTAEDLVPGRDVRVKIAAVLRYNKVKFKGGKGPDHEKPVLIALRFEGKERELGLNRTNTKILNKMYGSHTGGWKGKEIALYVAQVSAFGEMVDCVRIRDTGSRAATAAEAFLTDADDLQAGNGGSEEPETNSAAEREPGEDESSPLFGGH